MKVPEHPWTLMPMIYCRVLPTVHEQLRKWEQKALEIPDVELRNQALQSIETKTFHCEGGGIYGLLAAKKRETIIRFIVAYQTISDYLDNLCDRSTSLDPDDFESLHEAMIDALCPENVPKNYYQNRIEQNDGGYLIELVETCQDVLRTLPSYHKVSPALVELAHYYCELQVHKHVVHEERVPRLQKWFDRHKDQVPDMSWYEFSACTGSTLGIFCLVAYAAKGELSDETVQIIKEGYFPWVQGLHILLDYFIDQEEDKLEGDLNFCFYYQSNEELINRFEHFAIKADESIAKLPNKRFHSLINKGLLAIYLADEKVRKQEDVKVLSKKILRLGGGASLFFYMNRWIYRRA